MKPESAPASPLMFTVYRINHKKKAIYIGYTNNIDRRCKEHNYHLKKGTMKEMYDYLRKKKVSKIVLEPLRTFKSKTEAKRFEMLMILMYHFGTYRTLNKIPNISDR